MTSSVDEFLVKLGPIMPDKVKAWRQGIELGSAQNRALIERHVRIQFQHSFSRGEILLRPPTKSIFTGGFHLGKTVYSKPWGSFGLSSSELLQNLEIVRRSGAGKTNVALLLVDHLLKKRIPFIFFDWKRTCRDLLPAWPGRVRVLTPGRTVAPFYYNLLAPPRGLEAVVWCRQVVDTLAKAYTLGDGAKSLIHKAISTMEKEGKQELEPSALLGAVRKIPASGRAHGWKVSALRALESLTSEANPNPSEQTPVFQPLDLLSGATVLELDALSMNYKKCLIPLLCLYIFYSKLHSAKREELSLVVFVEEAHHLLHRQSQSSSESVMEMLIRQCREVGIALVVLDQHPHLLSPAVLGNSYCSICFNLKDPRDINRGSDLSQLSSSDKGILSRLPVGYGVVKTQDRWLRPFLVLFDLMEIEKGVVKDDDLEKLSLSKSLLSDPRVASERNRPDNVHSRLPLLLEEEAFTLALDVLKYPSDGVDMRYKRLRWSCDRGNRIKKSCLASQILVEETVHVCRSRRVILRLGPLAKKLGIPSRNKPVESISHSYWKETLAGLLRERGFRIQVEANLPGGGRADILAEKGEFQFAVEVETGKSDFIGNVRKCLAAKCTRVVIAVTKQKALGLIERKLAATGLLIPNKVDVVLAGCLALRLEKSALKESTLFP